MQKTEKKEADSDAGFSCEQNYQKSDEPLEKHPNASPAMEKAVECLKSTFFSSNNAQNKSSNAKSRLLLPCNKMNPKRNTLIDNFFSDRSKNMNQLISDENNGDDYSRTEYIDSWLSHTSLVECDTRSESTWTSESDLNQCKLQETISTLENKTTVVLMHPENLVQLKYTKLKRHLLKERVLTCQLITQKTISDLRAKLAEQIVESEQEWKNKICLDIETTQNYLRKISSLFVSAKNKAKKEVKKNEELKKNLKLEKNKKKYLKLNQKELKGNLDMKTQQIKNKDEKIKQLQKTIRLNEEIIKDMKNTNEKLERQTKENNIKNEENMKKEIPKLEKLKLELQKEQNLHRFTKNAYEALEEDWKILLKNSLEVHQALILSIQELNKVPNANNKYSFTKC